MKQTIPFHIYCHRITGWDNLPDRYNLVFMIHTLIVLGGYYVTPIQKATRLGETVCIIFMGCALELVRQDFTREYDYNTLTEAIDTK